MGSSSAAYMALNMTNTSAPELPLPPGCEKMLRENTMNIVSFWDQVVAMNQTNGIVITESQARILFENAVLSAFLWEPSGEKKVLEQLRTPEAYRYWNPSVASTKRYTLLMPRTEKQKQNGTALMSNGTREVIVPYYGFVPLEQISFTAFSKSLLNIRQRTTTYIDEAFAKEVFDSIVYDMYCFEADAKKGRICSTDREQRGHTLLGDLA